MAPSNSVGMLYGVHLLNERISTLRSLGITKELFGVILDRVCLQKWGEWMNVSFEIVGNPAGVLAWWKGKEDTLEETKLKVIFEVLDDLDYQDIASFLHMISTNY
jgi:hypothetical protein